MALTKSLALVAASSQTATRAQTGSTNLQPGTSSFTIEAWTKWTSLPSNNIMAWICKGNYSGAKEWQIYLNNSGSNWSWSMDTSSDGSSTTTATVTGLTAPTTGVWIHHALVYTTSTGVLTAFLNGVSDGTSGTNGVTSFNSGGAAFTLGNTDAGELPYFDGQFSLTRYWVGEARSGANINSNKCTVLGSTTNLSGEWTLDNVATDNSGNSNTLTLNGGAGYTTDVPSCLAGGGGTALPYRAMLGVGI